MCFSQQWQLQLAEVKLWSFTRLDSWPTTFLIFINDNPDVCQVFRSFLFADDTNLTADNGYFESIRKDLVNVEKWLNANNLF